MNKKRIITDFVEDLNFQNVIIWIGNIDKDKLYERLKRDKLNKLYRFDSVRVDNYMYVENCDLQNLVGKIDEYFNEGYIVYPLYWDGVNFLY